MSRGDILVVLAGDQTVSSLLCIGDPLIVEIDLPANHKFGPKCMQCQATVVRVSKTETGAPRVAMRIHKMRFQSCNESSRLEEMAETAARPVVM